MELYFKAVAAVLITAVIGLVLSKQNKDMSALLAILVCCMVATVAMQFLESILGFFDELEAMIQIDDSLLQILLKIVGVGIIGELAALICNDAGNAALGKSLQILSGILVLWLALPLLRTMLELINEILGGL